MDTTDFRHDHEYHYHRTVIRPSFWQSVVKIYEEFSSQSSIHGIKYTTQAKSNFGRCFWVLVLSLSILASGLLAKKFYEKHESASMRTLVKNNHDPSWRLRLPAITICHSNIATSDRVDAMLNATNLIIPAGLTKQDIRYSLIYLWISLDPSNRFEKEMTMLQRFLHANNLSIRDLFERVGPNCNDFLVMCLLDGVEKNCSDIITRSLTPFGFCCSFNYLQPSDRHRPNVSLSDKYTVNFGHGYLLSILLRPSKPHDRVASMIFGDGFKVINHERNTYPGPSSLEFVAATGLETVARFSGRKLSASPDVLRLKPNERDCRTTESIDDFYRADNCYVKCQERAFLRLCNCLPFYSSIIRDHEKMCNFTELNCLSRVKYRAYRLELRDPSCKCLPDCQNTVFSLVTTAVPMNAKLFNPSKFYKKAMTIPNATAIHIALSGQSGMRQRRELVLSWINLVSSLGGVFSLFLGCSFISIIEIFYFLFIWTFGRLRRRPI